MIRGALGETTKTRADRVLYPGAWVNIDNSGAAAIARSFNVTSITDHSAGDFTVTFTKAFSNATYAVVGSAGTGNHSQIWTNNTATAKAAGAVRVSTWSPADTLTDYHPTTVICIGR